jgi:hypothetical protein
MEKIRYFLLSQIEKEKLCEKYILPVDDDKQTRNGVFLEMECVGVLFHSLICFIGF